MYLVLFVPLNLNYSLRVLCVLCVFAFSSINILLPFGDVEGDAGGGFLVAGEDEEER
jgi:hypothetical protein